MNPPQELLHEINIYKPVILAGLNAITPLFAQSYTDEMGQPFSVQTRGAFSTERRTAPNIVVSFRASAAVFNSGQNILGFDPSSGLFQYGFYMMGAQIRYAIQARNEAEREWLLDTLALGFTGLVFVDPVSGTQVNNALMDYLGSQGIVATGWDACEYPNPVSSDAASPRPEGQVWEAVFPLRVDVSLNYYMPGVSANSTTLYNSIVANTDPNALPPDLPWQPIPFNEPPIYLSYL